MRGRKPKPTAEKQRDGNPGRRPIGVEPTTGPLGDAPLRPLGPAGAAWWRWVIDVWGHVLRDSDAQLVQHCAELHDKIAATQELIQQQGGEYVPTEYGPKRHPGVTDIRSMQKEIIKIYEQLGLNPTARVRLATVAPSPDDELNDIIDEGAALRAAIEDGDE